MGQFVTLHKCSLRFMGRNVFYAKEKVEHYPPLQYNWTAFRCMFCKQSEQCFPRLAGQRGPTAARNPSSAGMQYHLSKYLDNWIWEGSRSRHCNQWHCQQCHWEPASSCTTRSQTERGEDWSRRIFSRVDCAREVSANTATPKKTGCSTLVKWRSEQ